MKFLMVLSDLNLGGITTAAQNLSYELIQHGHDVSVLNMANQLEEKKIFDERVEILHFHGIDRLWNLSKKQALNAKGVKRVGLLVFGLAKKILLRINLFYPIVFRPLSEHFDVAIAYRQDASCYYYVINKTDAKIKLGFIHGDVTFWNGEEKVFLPFMSRFNKVCYVSEIVMNGFVKKYPFLSKNAVAIHNFFNEKQIKSQAMERCTINLSNKTFNICTISRVENNQKQMNLIPPICAKIKEMGLYDFHWYVIGDGPDYDLDTKLSREYGTEDVLSFEGKRENPFCILKHMDLSVLVSKSEAYPMSVIEAFILKVPMLVTNFNSAPEVVSDGNSGYIVENNVNSIAQMIYDLAVDKDKKYTQIVNQLKNSTFSNDEAYSQLMKALY